MCWSMTTQIYDIKKKNNIISFKILSQLTNVLQLNKKLNMIKRGEG